MAHQGPGKDASSHEMTKIGITGGDNQYAVNPGYYNQQQMPMMYGNQQQTPMMYGNQQQMPVMYGNQPGMPMGMNGMGHPVQPGMAGMPMMVGMPMVGGMSADPAHRLPHKQKIMQLSGIFVKQKMNLAEVISGCELANTYHVYSKKGDEVKKMGSKLYKCKEKSGWYSRNCLSNECREMRLKVENIVHSEDSTEICLLMEKECMCTCMCCNRPYFSITYVEHGENIYLGKVIYPFNFCALNFEVLDRNNSVKFTLEGDCCQCGYVCRNYPCEACQTVVFRLYDKNHNLLPATFIKRNKNCFKSMVSDSDNFAVDFLPNMDWEDRSLLLSLVLLVDFMLFEEKANNNQGGLDI